MSAMTMAEFLAKYDPQGTRVVATVDAAMDATPEGGPFVVVKHGRYAAVIALVPCSDEYLDIDIHGFADGQDAASSVFGMTEGKRFEGFGPGTGKTSYGRPAANTVVVLVGEQGEDGS